MNKIQKLKLALSKFLAEFSAVKTDKAILEYNEDGELSVGFNVYVTNEDGEYVPAADGEYVTEDEKTIVVADGVVTEIKEKEVEPEPVADPEPLEEPIEAEEEPSVDPEPEEVPSELDEVRHQIDELFTVVEKLLAEVAELKGKSDEAVAAVEQMSKMSAAKPAAVEIEKTASNKTGNSKLDAVLAGIREATK